MWWGSEVELYVVDGFRDGAGDGEELSFHSGAGHWEFDHTPVSIWATRIELCIFFNFYFLLLFFCGGHKGRGVNLERLERECVQGALWESTKQSIKRLLGRKRKPTLVFRWLVDWEEEGPWGMPNQKRKGQGSLYRRGSTKTEALELCELIISGSNPSFCFKKNPFFCSEEKIEYCQVTNNPA